MFLKIYRINNLIGVEQVQSPGGVIAASFGLFYDKGFTLNTSELNNFINIITPSGQNFTLAPSELVKDNDTACADMANAREYLSTILNVSGGGGGTPPPFPTEINVNQAPTEAGKSIAARLDIENERIIFRNENFAVLAARVNPSSTKEFVLKAANWLCTSSGNMSCFIWDNPNLEVNTIPTPWNSLTWGAVDGTDIQVADLSPWALTTVSGGQMINAGGISRNGANALRIDLNNKFTAGGVIVLGVKTDATEDLSGSLIFEEI